MEAMSGKDLVRRKIHVQLLEHELGRVYVHWNGMANVFVISRDCLHRAEVVGFAAGEKHELVEELEGGSGWLVYARYYNELKN